jgi:hypothetical protein
MLGLLPEKPIKLKCTLSGKCIESTMYHTSQLSHTVLYGGSVVSPVVTGLTGCLGSLLPPIWEKDPDSKFEVQFLLTV